MTGPTYSYSINGLVLIARKQCVYCVIQHESSKILKLK